MLKNADISSKDQIILKGILEGFSEVLDVSKLKTFKPEAEKIFLQVKQDSDNLTDLALYQMALHIAKNRALFLKEKKNFSTELSKIVPLSSPQETVETSETSIDNQELTIRQAIFDAFDFVGNLNKATTIEHINDEANKIFSWYLANDTSSNLYENVFRTAKKRAEEIVGAYQILEDQKSRAEMRIKKREEREREEQERQRISEVAKIELKELVAKMLEKNLTPVNKEALRYFKLIYLDNKRDPEIVHLFPGTSRDQRYQWKTRAVGMIAPYVSEDARKYIGEKTKRKYAANLLLTAAQIFVMKCQEG